MNYNLQEHGIWKNAGSIVLGVKAWIATSLNSLGIPHGLANVIAWVVLTLLTAILFAFLIAVFVIWHIMSGKAGGGGRYDEVSALNEHDSFLDPRESSLEKQADFKYAYGRGADDPKHWNHIFHPIYCGCGDCVEHRVAEE